MKRNDCRYRPSTLQRHTGTIASIDDDYNPLYRKAIMGDAVITEAQIKTASIEDICSRGAMQSGYYFIQCTALPRLFALLPGG